MQYKVKNITQAVSTTEVKVGGFGPVDQTNTSGKTIWIEGSIQGNSFPLGPQETAVVSDTALALLQKNFSAYISVLGTYTDDDAPVTKVVALSGTWALVSLDKFCTQLQFSTTATNAMVSFSGWDIVAGQTEPPVGTQLLIPANSATPGGALFSINMTMNASKEFYVKGTGSLTIFGV